MQMFMNIWDQLLRKAVEIVSSDEFQECIYIPLEKDLLEVKVEIDPKTIRV